jgi:hypothetical protein
MNDRPKKYVIEDYAHRAARLEGRRDQIPGSFILWEAEGVELPSGRRTGPTYVLWRPVIAAPPAEPQPAPKTRAARTARPVEPPPAPTPQPAPRQPQKRTSSTATSPAEQQPAPLPPSAPAAPAAATGEPVPAEASTAAPEKPRLPPTRNKRTRVSPRNLPKTTRHKGITRIDYPPKRTFGYMARVPWQGRMHQKFFSDKKYGDRLGALAAALEWRDQTERELGKPRSEEPVIAPTPTSNTGVLGVSRVISGGKPKMQVTWSENGKVRRTSFSIERHGERGALKLARATRLAADRRKREQALAERSTPALSEKVVEQ